MSQLWLDLCVRDVEKSTAFYRDILGFDVKETLHPEGRPMLWSHVALGDCHVMLGDHRLGYENMYPRPAEFRLSTQLNKWGVGATLFFRGAVPDVDTYYHQVTEAGATVALELRTAPNGWREFIITDPDGYRLAFAN